MRPRCINCAAPSAHDHHVVPTSLGGVATVPLCEECHGKAHGHRVNMWNLSREALAAKRARGEHHGAPPLGYSNAHGRLVPDAQEQAAVARIHALRAEGRSLREIAAALTAEGYTTKRGGRWASETVRKVLMFRKVAA